MSPGIDGVAVYQYTFEGAAASRRALTTNPKGMIFKACAKGRGLGMPSKQCSINDLRQRGRRQSPGEADIGCGRGGAICQGGRARASRYGEVQLARAVWAGPVIPSMRDGSSPVDRSLALKLAVSTDRDTINLLDDELADRYFRMEKESEWSRG